MDAPIDWLLEGSPWIQLRTRLDLLDASEDDPIINRLREETARDIQVGKLLEGLNDWPGEVIASHKSAGQPFHRLTFLADLGMDSKDPRIESITNQIRLHVSEEGLFQLPINISPSYGGSGIEKEGWALCDAPLLVYSLVRLGLKNDPAVQKAISFLISLNRENGWPCVVSKELGNFRGPGRKEDPCPYATLIMLKLIGLLPDQLDSAAAHIGVETLLDLWQNSQIKHPYIFYMGDDFRKLKTPFIWYDLMHVLEVLSHFTWARKDPRYVSMLSVLTDQADDLGRFVVGSVWQAWKDWEFGQKKVPSRWLTLMAWRIISRSYVSVS